MVHRKTHERPGPARSLLSGSLLVLVPLLLLGGLLQSAQAQFTPQDVKWELDKTDQVILRARELASEAVAVSSRGHLDAAVKLQRLAWDEFRRGRERYGQARELTLRARREALKAMDAARIEKQTQASVVRALEQAEERAHEASERVRESGDPQAMRVFEQGIDHLRRARKAHLDRQYVQANRLAILATTLFDRAGRLAHGGLSAGVTVEVSLERTTNLLLQVEVVMAERGLAPTDAPLFREAERLLRHGRSRFQEGRLRQALTLSLAARQKALRLLADLNHRPGEQEIAEAIEDLHVLYVELSAEILESGGEREQRAITEGRKMLRRASSLLSEGKAREALQHLLAAERLLKEAAKSAGL